MEKKVPYKLRLGCGVSHVVIALESGRSEQSIRHEIVENSPPDHDGWFITSFGLGGGASCSYG